MTNAILLPAALAVVLLASAPVAADEGPQDAHGETEGFFHELAVPFGILTLALLLATAAAGLFMRKKPLILRRWHKRFAIPAVISALCHAVLVALSH